MDRSRISQGGASSQGSAAASPSSSRNARQLMVPSAHVPWSVEVISTMPKELIGKLSECDTGAVTSDGASWVCLGQSPEGKFFTYPQDAVVTPARRVTTAAPAATTTSTPKESDQDDGDAILLPPKYVGHLYHPKLKMEQDESHHQPCLVALERRDRQVVHVYALHPTTGQLFAKKLTPVQIRTNMVMPFTGYARMELSSPPSSQQQQQQQQQPPEVFTCLQPFPHAAGVLVAGTSLGRLWLVKCSSVPLALHVYPLEYQDQTSSSSSYSLLGRIFGTTPSKKKMRLDPAGSSSSSSSVRVQVILPLPSTTSTASSFSTAPILTAATPSAPARFWMVTQGGTIVAFEPSTTTETTTSPTSNLPWNYSSHVVAYLADAFPPTEGRPTHLQVLQAAMDPTPLLSEGAANVTSKLVAHFLVQTQDRLYWMTTTAALSPTADDSDFRVVRVHWLNRFPDGVRIHVGGLVVAENRMAYAAMSPSSSSGPILVMALDTNKLPLAATANPQHEEDDGDEDEEAAIFEVDLPVTQVPSLLPRTLALDRVTHGCTLLATSGIGLRIRCLPPTTTSRRPSPSISSHNNNNLQTTTLALAKDVAAPSSSSGVQSSKLLTLTSHLRSAFWHAYQHFEGALGTAASTAVIMPPSLEQASVVYLEAAVVSVGQQLQQQPGEAAAASSQNPLEWHLAYINFLQQGGLYRKLSTSTRYKLMGMGQEVTVFSHLLQQTNQQQGILTSRLQPSGIANWFYDIAKNHQFLDSGSGSTKEQQDARVLWCAWLCLALKAATSFREERAGPFYDIPPEPELWIKSTLLTAAIDGTQYLWTSQRVLQTCMVELLECCKRSHATAVQQGLIETVVQAALQSHVDTSFSVADQERYADVKALAIPLLRNMVGRDDLAFAWSIDHCYFDGLCQIAKDHEKRHDEKNYVLEATLFSKLQDCVDTTTGLAFGPFCLQWHAERGLYGHVLNYGHHCCARADDLRQLLQRDERLRQYRWIHSIRQGDYMAATDHLLTNSKNPDATYADLSLSLSLAKLSNLVVQNDSITERSVTEERLRYIDNKQEQIQAQVMLSAEHSYYGSNESTANIDPAVPFHLRTPDELLSWTLDETLGQVKDQDVRVQYCMLGIAICLTMDNKDSSNGDESEMNLGAARIWAKTILLESPLWLEWIQTQPDLTDMELIDLILESTVFGRVLKQCWKEPSSKRLAFGPSVERNALALLNWDHVATTEMQRLLQHVCRLGQRRQ